MTDNVYWILEAEVQPGKEGGFRSLMKEMVASTRADEAGALNYEWSADGKVCHIYERYADCAATMTHLKTFGEKFAGRFGEVLRVTRMVVYGSPSPAVREALAGGGAVFMQEIGGFSR